MKIDDQGTGYGDDGKQLEEEGTEPRTSSDPEHYSDAEESK